MWAALSPVCSTLGTLGALEKKRGSSTYFCGPRAGTRVNSTCCSVHRKHSEVGVSIHNAQRLSLVINTFLKMRKNDQGRA